MENVIRIIASGILVFLLYVLFFAGDPNSYTTLIIIASTSAFVLYFISVKYFDKNHDQLFNKRKELSLMKSLALFTTLFTSLFLVACQPDETSVTEEAALPSEVPQFSISTDTQLDTTTRTLCWEECENSEARINDQLSDLDDLSEEAPIFQVDDQQHLTVKLGTEIEPTRLSYTEYEVEPDISSTATENVDDGIIEIVGGRSKTYIVRAEWYSEGNEKLLGSIYTVFTFEN